MSEDLIKEVGIALQPRIMLGRCEFPHLIQILGIIERNTPEVAPSSYKKGTPCIYIYWKPRIHEPKINIKNEKPVVLENQLQTVFEIKQAVGVNKWQIWTFFSESDIKRLFNFHQDLQVALLELLHGTK